MPRTELRTEVEIAAPAAHVFGVLSDLGSYPEWNPFITSLAGKLELGQRLSVELSLPEGKTYLLEPRLSAIASSEERYELSWRSSYVHPALLEAEHLFQVIALAPRQTRFVQGLNFSGFLLRFAGSALTMSARGCVYMNQALKKRAEATFRE